MSDLKTHCRLCAELKPYSKLVNLETDEERGEKVMEKLIRLSLEATINSTDDTLSKTICFPCMDSLDSAFNFVINVESCQSKLNAFITEEAFKEEVIDDLGCDPFENSDENTSVKEEFDSSNELDLEAASENVLNEDSIIKKEEDNCTDKLESLESWKDYSWVCAHCATMFPNVDELREHSMEYHECCNAYRCTDCNIRKLTLDKFVSHVKRHRKHLKLSCYKCHMIFSKHYDAIKHKKVHSTTECKCRGCNTTFATLKQLTEHSNLYQKDRGMRKVPAEHLTEDFSCVFCLKKFTQKSSLITHLLIHTDRKRDHTCEKCGKCFLIKANLDDHMTTHDDSRPYQCEICKHSFRRLSQLRSHISIHDGKKPFSCEKCGKLFRLRRQLKSHSIIHTDSLPFVCSYCQKGFKFKTILNQHIRQHTGSKPYECQICQKNFTNWPNYNKHMKQLHDMNMAKRQKAPGGLLPINPPSGNVDVEPETNKTGERKRYRTEELEKPNQSGRPKTDKRKRVSKLKT